MSRTQPFFFSLLVSGILFQLNAIDAEARPFDRPTEPESATAPIGDSSGDGEPTADEGEENPDEWEIEPDFAPDLHETQLYHQGHRFLEIGTEISGVLGPQGVMYTFFLDRRQTVGISTAGPTDTLGTLLDEGRRVVASDDKGGPGKNFRIEADLVPGWYVLRIEGSWGSRGPYTLHLSERP